MVREEKRRRGEDVRGGGRYMGDRRRERETENLHNILQVLLRDFISS